MIDIIFYPFVDHPEGVWRQWTDMAYRLRMSEDLIDCIMKINQLFHRVEEFICLFRKSLFQVGLFSGAELEF